LRVRLAAVLDAAVLGAELGAGAVLSEEDAIAEALDVERRAALV
jgi:hypothetical protein